MTELRPVSPEQDPSLDGDAWGRIEEAYRSSVERSQGVVLLALELFDPEHLIEACDVDLEGLLAAFSRALRALPEAEGVVLAQRQKRLIVLLPGRSLAEGEGLGEALLSACRALEINGRTGCDLPVIGLSHTPSERVLHLEALVRVAEEGARVAGFRGRGRMVHTRLYGSIESQVRREIEHEGAAFSPPPVRGGAFDLAHRDSTDASIRQSNGASAPELAGGASTDAARASESDQSAEMDRLRRRVAKLLEALEDAERRLAVAQGRHAVDDGVASRFRGVQGLDEGERDFERKWGLLRELLEANLALREAIQANGKPSTTPPIPDVADQRCRA